MNSEIRPDEKESRDVFTFMVGHRSEGMPMYGLSYFPMEFITINDTGNSINLFWPLNNQILAIKFTETFKESTQTIFKDQIGYFGAFTCYPLLQLYFQVLATIHIRKNYVKRKSNNSDNEYNYTSRLLYIRKKKN